MAQLHSAASFCHRTASDLDAGDGRAVPKRFSRKTLMECTVSREAAHALNFRST
jgi:hypothetical protein